MTGLFGLTACCFAGCVLLHLLLVRAATRADFVRNGYVFISVLGAILLPATLRLGALGALFFYVTLAVLWNLYTIFFINLMNSVSLRIMVEIDNAPRRELSAQEIEALYSDEEALRSRLRGLAQKGFLREDGPVLALTPKGRTLAGILAGIRRLFGIETYG